jgi:hypothetical protein
MAAGCFVALALVACGSDPDREGDAASAGGPGASGPGGGATGGDGAGANAGGGGGVGGGGGAGGNTVTGTEHQPDHDALAACGTPTCMKLFAQRIEGGYPATINHAPCTLAAMRDGVVGAYDVTLDHTWTNGRRYQTIRLFVTPSGDVEIGVVETERQDGFGDFFVKTDIRPTMRCTPKGSDFFDTCLGFVESAGPDAPPYPDEAFACIYPEGGGGLPWFLDCEPLPPTCE